MNAGTYSYTLTLSGYNPNYSVTGYNPATFTINPATLTYTANSASGMVGQPFPAFDGTVTGFLPGDTLSNATTGTALFGTTANGTSAAGLYAIDGSGLSSGNYQLVQASGNSTAFTLTGTPTPVLPTPIPIPVSIINYIANKNNGSTPTPVNLTGLFDSFETSFKPVIVTFNGETGFILSDLGIEPSDNLQLVDGNSITGFIGEGDYDMGREMDRFGGVGHYSARFLIREGSRGFSGIKVPPFVQSRLDLALDRDVRDELFDATQGQGDRVRTDLTTITDRDGKPARGFYTRGGYNAFDLGAVPPPIEVRLSDTLSADVREALLSANPFGSSTGAMTDQSGHTVPGFLALPGGYFAFNHAPLPPPLQLRLSEALSADVRAALSDATKTTSSGAVTDQGGHVAPGFFVLPGSFFGFDHTALPPLIQEHLSKALSSDVRAELSNAK